MKVVILAGGLGTRLSEDTEHKPKPLVEVGHRPMLWHIMKIYAHYGFNEFIICLGYKGYMIKEYFSNYMLHTNDITIDMKNGRTIVHDSQGEDFVVTLVDTGDESMTGGRIRRVEKYCGGEPFMMTYGDGVADIDMGKLLESHREAGRLATVTAVRPPGRFGAMDLEPGGRVSGFVEKPRGEGGWINGGFFVLEPGIFKYIDGDESIWEQEPLRGIVADGQLNAYRHNGFWKPMDTLRDKRELEALWAGGSAPWKLWR